MFIVTDRNKRRIAHFELINTFNASELFMTMQLDRFSDVAEGYARYRPVYPDALYQWLLNQVQQRNCAWDAGTGNGQVAYVLSQSFERVIGSDISSAQLMHALIAPNIQYKVAPAEQSGLEDHSVDLITVAQAAHWFQLDAFARETARVAKKHALLALWGYTLFEAEPGIDSIVRKLYEDILHDYWDPHRDLVNRKYADLQMPFLEIDCPVFEMHNVWSAEDVLGYLRTWSAVNKYQHRHGYDPVKEIEQSLVEAFAGRRVRCTTQIFMRGWRI